MTDEQKRIKAIIEEQQRLLRENPKLKGKTDAQLEVASLRSARMTAQHNDPAYIKWKEEWEKKIHDPAFREKCQASIEKRDNNPVYQANRQAGIEKRNNNTEWRANNLEALEKLHNDPEFREKYLEAMKKVHDDPEFREKYLEAMKKVNNDPAYRAKYKAGIEKRNNDPAYRAKNLEAMKKLHNNPEFKAKSKAAIQKANSKAISCNGVIYPSRAEAGRVLAPASYISVESKGAWIGGQMKKYPDRYFYVDEAGNKIEQPVKPKPVEEQVDPKPVKQQIDPKPVEEPVDPKSVDPTYMSLEERKALAKLKRQQDDTDK